MEFLSHHPNSPCRAPGITIIISSAEAPRLLDRYGENSCLLSEWLAGWQEKCRTYSDSSQSSDGQLERVWHIAQCQEENRNDDVHVIFRGHMALSVGVATLIRILNGSARATKCLGSTEGSLNDIVLHTTINACERDIFLEESLISTLPQTIHSNGCLGTMISRSK